MHEYEISNPSDECYVSSDEDIVASAAVLLLGNGAYPLSNKEGRSLPTFFLFGGDCNNAYKEAFGVTLDAFLSIPANLIKVAECLKTFRYAKERTSMNNIGKTAAALEKNLLKRAAQLTTEQSKPAVEAVVQS